MRTSLTQFLLFTAYTVSVTAFAPISSVRLFSTETFAKATQLHESRSDTVVSTIRDSVSLVKEKNAIESYNEGILTPEKTNGFDYGEFAKNNPLGNSVAIASTKTAIADLIAQLVIARTPIMDLDFERTLLFFVFGGVYSGWFQYLYQVNIFKKLFDIDSFTSQPWAEKLKDKDGLKALAAQTALDLFVCSFVYLPAFYIFKAGVFSGTMDPGMWASAGVENWSNNFSKDEVDLLRVWFPADLVCFSVPLYLRLPIRHSVSFLWTIYLSFVRGGH